MTNPTVDEGQPTPAVFAERWTAQDLSDGDDGRCCWQVNADLGVEVALVDATFGLSSEECEQVARLIAAAPETKRQRDELLAAAKLGAMVISELPANEIDGFAYGTLQDVLHSLNAAIARCER